MLLIGGGLDPSPTVIGKGPVTLSKAVGPEEDRQRLFTQVQSDLATVSARPVR